VVHPIPDGSNIRNKLDRSPCHLVVNSCIKFRDNMGGKVGLSATKFIGRMVSVDFTKQ